MRTTMPFGELKPDDAPHGLPGLSIPGYPASARDLLIAEGVYPSATGYRPIGDFSSFATALPGTFMGGAAFIGTAGDVRLIAGNATDLFSGAGGNWTSRLGSLTVPDRWRFTQFGDDIVCVNGGQPVDYNVTADTAALLTGSPPTATFCATVRDFVVLGRADGVQNVVQWSEQGNCKGWTVGVQLAGLQPRYNGGKIMGLTSGEVCYIIKRFGVDRMSFTGDATDPWQFDEISTNDGCVAEGSLIQAGALHFFRSDRGFVMFDGAKYNPISTERIEATFKRAYSTDDLVNLWGTAHPVLPLAIWIIQGKMWIYNWVLDRWATADLPIISAFPAFTSGTTLEQLDAIYGSLEAVPYSLDDPRFAGGTPFLTVVHNDGTFGSLSGSNISATIGLPMMELAQNRQTRLQRVRPITDAIDGVTLSLDARQRLGDPEAITAYTVLTSRGDMPIRKAARSMKMTLDIAAGTDWTFLQALEAEYAVGGRL